MKKIEKLIECLKECGFEFEFYKDDHGETEIRIPCVCDCIPDEDFGVASKDALLHNPNLTCWTDEAYIHITINDEDLFCPVDMMIEIPAPERD